MIHPATELRWVGSSIGYGVFATAVIPRGTIVYVKDEATVGVGAGQMSRVDSVEIAIRKAGDRAAGAVLASDAFFPFPDSIESSSTVSTR